MDKLEQKLLEGDLARIEAAVEEVIDDNRHYRELVRLALKDLEGTPREHSPEAIIRLLEEDLEGLVKLRRDIEQFRRRFVAEAVHA